MITVTKRHNPGREDDSLMIAEMMGLSTDSKPTGENIGINSLFMELDTGKVYYFTGEDWAEVGAGSGSGSELA